MCCASSSTISASRVGSTSSCAIAAVIAPDQSGMFELRDPSHRVDEGAPRSAALLKTLPAGRCDPVVAAPPLSGLLDPAALEESAPFEAVEQRIERRNVQTKDAIRPPFDQLRDLVTVPRPPLDERQDQKLGAPFLELAIERRRVHMFHSNICLCYTNGARRTSACSGRPDGAEGRARDDFRPTGRR